MFPRDSLVPSQFLSLYLNIVAYTFLKTHFFFILICFPFFRDCILNTTFLSVIAYIVWKTCMQNFKLLDSAVWALHFILSRHCLITILTKKNFKNVTLSLNNKPLPFTYDTLASTAAVDIIDCYILNIKSSNYIIIFVFYNPCS